MEPTTDKKSNGALIGAIVVILILVLGGFYLWQSNSLTEKNSEPIPVNDEQQSIGESNQAAVIAAMETDLNLVQSENEGSVASDSSLATDVASTQ
ncbi:MAG: hypothetical protein M3Q34_04625 [bacterium]|nr:hypothetical protein [bacterium]